jgi:hypothetical protein
MDQEWQQIPQYDASWRVIRDFWDMDKCSIGIRSGFLLSRNPNAELYEDIFKAISLAIKLRHLGVVFPINLLVGIIIDHEMRRHDRTFEFFFEDDPRSGRLIQVVHAMLHNVVAFHVSRQSEYTQPAELQRRIDNTIIEFIKVSSLWDIDADSWFWGIGPPPEGETMGRRVLLDRWANPEDVLFYRMIGDCYITAAHRWMTLNGRITFDPVRKEKGWVQEKWPEDHVCPTCICSDVLPEVASKVVVPCHKIPIEPSLENFHEALMAIVDTVVYIETARKDSLRTENESFMDTLIDGLLPYILSHDTLKVLYSYHPFKPLEVRLAECSLFDEDTIDGLKALALDVARDFLNTQLRARRIKRYTLRPDPETEGDRDDGLITLNRLRDSCEDDQGAKQGTHASLGVTDEGAFTNAEVKAIEDAIYGIMRLA